MLCFNAAYVVLCWTMLLPVNNVIFCAVLYIAVFAMLCFYLYG
jgi:hypothetical protein